MRFVPVTICAALLSASLGFGASAATAEDASLSSCVKLASQVRDALSSNAQSPSFQAATKEKGYGQDFCANGLYKNGVEHYAEALKLLGASKG
ncbi:MAG TPA: hypothetical protein VGI20_06610 [Rhizomicrobium sp.]|jgi:hypothetical protein